MMGGPLSDHMNQSLHTSFRNAIITVRDEFRRNPLRFFSEKDVHWLFCREVENELVRHGIQDGIGQLWPTAIEGFATSLVHQEYGTIERRGQRYDVCLLAPDEVSQIDRYDLTIGGNYVRPLAIVEYSTERYGQYAGWGDVVDKFVHDIQKLAGSGAADTYADFFYRIRLVRMGSIRRRQEYLRERLRDILHETEGTPIDPFASIWTLCTGEYEGITVN